MWLYDVFLSEDDVKSLVKNQFGPKKKVLGTLIDVSVSQYSPEEMSEVLTKMQAWAATDLHGLQLKGKEE